MDTTNNNINEEIPMAEEPSPFDEGIMDTPGYSARKTFIADKYEGTLDMELLRNVTEHIVETNKSMKSSEKHLQWRSFGFVPISNNHALRVIVRNFIAFIPKEIYIRYGEHNLLSIEHLSNRRFDNNLQPMNLIIQHKTDDKEIWDIDLTMRKQKSKPPISALTNELNNVMFKWRISNSGRRRKHSFITFP